MKKNIFIFSVLILTSCFSMNHFAQQIDSLWAPISYEGKLVYLDLSEVQSFTGNDIYVWTLEKHSEPLVIESIDKKVYSTKTYYLLNKELNKYSIKEVIYFDNRNNVLEDFSYNAVSDDPQYKYSYPIFKGSLADLILQRCLREIENK
jgi:hypothetical protein